MRAHDFLENEGDPEGVPHMTPTLIKHIIQQVDTEGPRAISKSVEWGDGASRELTAYIVDKLKDLVDTEEVDEMAGEVHGGIRKVLQKKGYKYLGSGIDKQAWLEPGTGQVLLVFGYRKGHPEDFSPDQHMFIDWINYCNRHKNKSIHLPRFSGFESFQFQGQNYIQARMEALHELNLSEKTVVPYLDDLGELIEYNSFEEAMQKIADHARFNVEAVIDSLGGPKNAESLVETVRIVREFGEDHGYSIDLHGGNYMKRADGTIVVNDPFVLWLGGSGG